MTGVADFIQGDFTQEECYHELLARIGTHADVVLSDMAPNLTGVKTADQARSVGLVEEALDMALLVLQTGGHFAAKVFQGAGVDEVLTHMRSHFNKVKIFKPSSSRPKSAEIYIVGLGVKKTIESLG